MDVFSLVVVSLAVARITRLVTADKLTERARVAVLRRLNPNGMLAYLAVCDWCASVYVAAGVVSVYHFWEASIWIYLALAASYVAGFLNSRSED